MNTPQRPAALPSERYFTYEKRTRIGLTVSAAFLVLWPLPSASFVMIVLASPEEFWRFLMIFLDPLRLGWLWILGLIGVAYGIVTHCPVRISDPDIRSYLFGSCGQVISWAKLESVRKRISLNPYDDATVSTIVLRSGHKRIWIVSTIQRYEELRVEINTQLLRHNVEVITIGGLGLTREVTRMRPGAI